MKRPIENNSSPGQAVYEPFCGSGTTIIAAEMTGRICHAIELDPLYVDVAVTRWQQFTGHEARLEESGKTLAEIASERLPEVNSPQTAGERSAMRGRKPTPTHLKLVRGNPGKRPLNASEPKPQLTLPSPPAESVR